MPTPNTASELNRRDHRAPMSAARSPNDHSGAANDGRLGEAHSSERTVRSTEGPKLALTLEEAAAELSVSTATIRRMIRRGSLRAVRLGDGPRARRRVSRSALEEFLNAES